MSKRLQRNLPGLRSLKTAKKSVRKALIGNASRDLILCLVECAKNIIKGKVRVNSRQFQTLNKYGRQLCQLVKNKTTVAQRKKVLQTGGFLFSILAPILGSLLGGR